MKWPCALIQPRLPDYPDGELSPFWKRQVEAHLKKCPECRRELEELAAAVRLYQAEAPQDPGPAFWQEFEQELHLKLAQVNQGREEPASRLGRLPHYVFGAAALAGVVALAVYLGPFTSPTPAPEMAPRQEEAQVAATQTTRDQEPPQARQEIAAALAPPPAIDKTLPPEPNSTEKIKALADRMAQPELRLAGEVSFSLAAGKLESALRHPVLSGPGLWPEDDILSWDVDAVVADFSPEERADLKRRLESRR